MTRSDVAIFDKEKSTTLSPNASGFVTAGAMTMKTPEQAFNIWGVSSTSQ